MHAVDELRNIPHLTRIETVDKEQMTGLAMDLTHGVYPHDQIYGQYCTIQEHIDAPPEDVYRYLANPYTLAEWTYSLRDFGEPDAQGRIRSLDKVGGKTVIFTKTVVNPEAMTVDFHCAWDQPDELWMIYLMRVVPAELVLKRSGSVVLWTNCRHPYYDKNPFPERAPADRTVWVGDLWPFFYAGHHVEMQNLKRICEHRHAHGLAIPEGKVEHPVEVR